MNSWKRVVASVCLALAATNALAATIRVPADQTSVQEAINTAADGDVVLVSPGTYAENINFFGKAITVESEQGAEVTILDGGAITRVVTFANSEGRESVIRGFTITNGRGTLGGGIGAYSTSPTIIENIITGNAACNGAGIGLSAASALIVNNEISFNSPATVAATCGGNLNGGGIMVSNTSTTEIIDNFIVGNESLRGGGIMLQRAGDPVIRGNVISDNFAFGLGGGIGMVERSDALIENNLIYRNLGESGGAIGWAVRPGNRGPRIVHNTMVDNPGFEAGTIYAGGSNARVEMINNIIYSQRPEWMMYCDVGDPTMPIMIGNVLTYAVGPQFTPRPYHGTCTDQTGLNGNIIDEPLLADIEAGDFRLRAGSSALDRGIGDSDLSVDFVGNPRAIDGDGDRTVVPDMGAFEAVPPVASAGRDQRVNPSASATLDASASSDADGGIETYSWRQTSGTVVELSDPQSAAPAFTAPASASTLLFEVTVTDDLGYVSTDQVAVSVRSSGSGGGCTIGVADGRIDPTLPLLVLLSLLHLMRRLPGSF